MKKVLMTLVGAVLGAASFAQTDYPIFRDTATLQAADSGRLSLQVDNINYLRNYEWFGNIPNSYTLLGTMLMPQLKYQVNPYFSVKGGLLLRREFGRPGLVTVEPMFTARYQKKGLTFIMGTLEGGLNHRFVEPIYNIERFIVGRMDRVEFNDVTRAATTRNEQGLQLKIDKKRFWADWFIDWRESIVIGDNFREQLNSGISTRTLVVDRPGVKLTVPLQALVSHYGGQISTSNMAIESLFNGAAGLSAQFPMGRGGLLRSVQTDAYYVGYKNISGNKLQLYNEGYGWLGSVLLKSRWNLDLELRYWNGNTFFGPVGLPLYNSISEKIRGFGEPERSLVFATLIYDKELFPNVSIDLRLEPYYDLKNKFLEYGYSAFLRFNKDFFLKKLR
ncbi:hypothetical protein EPD60_02970 [Flaviaesturariibacter flavus]|uniref:Uncharacterized protein n=1 Tax=Flaviaesturariibacter flavus TaxID=2502780 RepID=A0A4R1BN01_9BACT|nr:hypothetical protein [Flaviaesturariibacter flavus]TCJ18736.1 hypothetical protein EPD60_02970 [Flaviaesturariibacter flavus]